MNTSFGQSIISSDVCSINNEYVTTENRSLVVSNPLKPSGEKK